MYKDKALPLALLFHGWQVSKNEPILENISHALAREGYLAVRIDSQNNRGRAFNETSKTMVDNGNESSGKIHDFKWEEPLNDAARVLWFLDNDRITQTFFEPYFPAHDPGRTLLVGYSYGGFEAREVARRITEKSDLRFSSLKPLAVIDLSGAISPRLSFEGIVQKTMDRLKAKIAHIIFKRFTNAKQVLESWKKEGIFPIPFGDFRAFL